MAALVIFTVDVRRLAGFYEAVLGAEPLGEPSGDIRLVNDRDEVLIHSIPQKMAKTIEITTPPTPREATPIKPVFTIDSLEAALLRVAATGGTVTDRTFTMGGLTRHDVLDPDGNVIQLRATAPSFEASATYCPCLQLF
jgi:predicted enzyme related to lactoylglutathione lyase